MSLLILRWFNAGTSDWDVAAQVRSRVWPILPFWVSYPLGSTVYRGLASKNHFLQDKFTYKKKFKKRRAWKRRKKCETKKIAGKQEEKTLMKFICITDHWGLAVALKILCPTYRRAFWSRTKTKAPWNVQMLILLFFPLHLSISLSLYTFPSPAAPLESRC
jgi:hypothetical protein